MTTFYFDKPGKQNTQKTLELAIKVAKKKRIRKIVLASATGFSARQAAKIRSGLKLIVVGIERRTFPKYLVKQLERANHQVIFRREVESAYPQEKTIYQSVSQGTKIALEVALVATLRKAVKVGEEVIAVAGTGVGADTAVIVKAAKDFEYLTVGELICKPYFI